MLKVTYSNDFALMHIGMIDLQMNMEGPIAEINISEIDVEWNGAIAFIDRDGVLNYGSPNYIKPRRIDDYSRIKRSDYVFA